MVVIGLVRCRENASSYLRKYRNVDILVAQFQDIVGLVNDFFGQHVIQRVRVNIPFGTLVDTTGEKDRIHFRIAYLVSRYLFRHGFHFYLSPSWYGHSSQEGSQHFRFHRL